MRSTGRRAWGGVGRRHRRGPCLPHPQRCGYRVSDQARLGDAREFRHPDTVREPRQQPAAGLQRQPGLADAARAGDRAEPVVGQQVDEARELMAAPDEPRHLRGEVVGQSVHGRDRWELPVRPGEVDLHEPSWCIEVGEPVDAQIGELRTLRQQPPHVLGRLLRHQHLAGMTAARQTATTPALVAGVIAARSAQHPFAVDPDPPAAASTHPGRPPGCRPPQPEGQRG